MALPDYTELLLEARYGPELDDDDLVSTRIALVAKFINDEVEQKFIEGVTLLGVWIPLNHYVDVNTVVIQNTSANNGHYEYIENTTGTAMFGDLNAGEFIIICDPRPLNGITLYDESESDIDVHITIFGVKPNA